MNASSSGCAGSIRIDGHDIRDFDLKSLRKHVAIVPQETVCCVFLWSFRYILGSPYNVRVIDSVVMDLQTLFTGTVAENIAYGDMSEALDMEKIEKAGRMANAEDFIRNLPDDYNTHLGDRATTLSGGQRQRCVLYILPLGMWISILPSHLILFYPYLCPYLLPFGLQYLKGSWKGQGKIEINLETNHLTIQFIVAYSAVFYLLCGQVGYSQSGLRRGVDSDSG